MIDLHTHSTVSDGTDAPAALVQKAAAAGITILSLTDHDAVAGVAAAVAAGEKTGVRVIPGVELNATFPTELHVLGYGIDYTHPRLAEVIRYALTVRQKRMEEICRRLREQGLPITMEEVRDEARGGLLCGAHFAVILARKGFAATPGEAFKKYIGAGTPAYVNWQALTPAEAVDVVLECGGVPVLAHLNRTRLSLPEIETLLDELQSRGLWGIEGYYSEYTAEEGETYRALAARRGLFLTAGTDYHGENKPHIQLGRGFGDMDVPESAVAELLRVLGRK